VQRLKPVSNIDIKTCKQCGGALKVTASIEVPVVIEKILSYLKDKNSVTLPDFLPEDNAAAPTRLVFWLINDLFRGTAPANRAETGIKHPVHINIFFLVKSFYSSYTLKIVIKEANYTPNPEPNSGNYLTSPTHIHYQMGIDSCGNATL
jgi:hypothetical protein